MSSRVVGPRDGIAGFIGSIGVRFIERRHDEQVHRCDLWHMIAQKRPPALIRRSAVPSDDILRHSGLSDLEAELQKLAVDARRTPERVLNAHLLDQRTQICGRPPPFRDLHRH